MKLRTPLLAIVAAALVPAAPASAATVSSEGPTVTVAAPGPERNSISVSRRSAGGVIVRDRRTPLTAGAGCTQVRPDRVDCGTAETAEIVADLGPMSDSIGLGATVPARGVLRGGSGNDTLRGGSRNDLLAGGTGRDLVTYSGRTGDVRVTLAGGADDGLDGEGDDVVEVERVNGGNGFDVLVGTDAGEALSGGPGDDRLDGAGGDDVLTGARGNDLLQGGPGDDAFVADRAPDDSDALQGGDGADLADYGRRTPSANVIVDPDGFADDGDRPGDLRFDGPMPAFLLLGSAERDNVLPDVESVRGGAGADVLRTSNAGGSAVGGAGTDVLYGGPGPDSLSGDSGFDRLVARDGRIDTVRCGTEVDRVWVDLDDPVDLDCESRTTSFVPRVAAAGQTLEAAGLRVRVECPPQAFVRCQGTLRATTVRRVQGGRTARLGLGSYGLVPGAAEDVVIPFDEEGREIVARFAPLRVRVAIKGRDQAGAGRPSSTTLVLRR